MRTFSFRISIFIFCFLALGALCVNAQSNSPLANFINNDCARADAARYNAACRAQAINGALPPLIISEFRLASVGGAEDEFIEIYNASDTPHTVSSTSGIGYGIAASDGVLRCVILNGIMIPGRGHFLCVNSDGYSYDSYPTGSGGTATGNAGYNIDIPPNAGIALFTTNITGDFSLATRMDAVGSTSEANALYREGAGYTPLNTGFINAIDYSLVRVPQGNMTNNDPNDPTLPIVPFPQDSDDNAVDFYVADINGTSTGPPQRFGAPGPENLSSPVTTVGDITRQTLDPCFATGTPPNRIRDLTNDPGEINDTFGRVEFRRTFTNNTGSPITRLRFRILKITTFPAMAGTADLRALSSAPIVVMVDRLPCGVGTGNVTVEGTTLERDTTVPSLGQPNGGSLNSSLSADAVTAATPLLPGASIDLRFLFGIQQTGTYRFAIAAEVIPSGGSLWTITGDTEGTSDTEGSPTAATVSVAGRVLNPAGGGVSKALVTLTDTSGQNRNIVTGSFGYFSFSEVAAGQTYVVSVASRQYQFAPQTINVTEDVSDLNFSAQ